MSSRALVTSAALHPGVPPAIRYAAVSLVIPALLNALWTYQILRMVLKVLGGGKKAKRG